MIVENPRVLIPKNQLSDKLMLRIERYGRVCYKSENKIKEDASDFIGSVIRKGHESIIEHEKATALFIVDRGVSHEIVRHRIASYSQESTRYCNYSKDRFGGEISVIKPYFFIDDEKAYNSWENACLAAEKSYMDLLQYSTPQEARSVLPNSLKTELVVTFNLREWRHFFKLRATAAAHPQMRQVVIPLLLLFKKELPVLFSDIEYDERFPQKHYAEVVWTDDLLQPLLSNNNETTMELT